MKIENLKRANELTEEIKELEYLLFYLGRSPKCRFKIMRLIMPSWLGKKEHTIPDRLKEDIHALILRELDSLKEEFAEL